MLSPDVVPGGGATLTEATTTLQVALTNVQTPEEAVLAIATATMQGLNVVWGPSSAQPGQTEVIVTNAKP